MSEHIHDLKNEEQEKRPKSGSPNWIAGLVLIGLGVAFLVSNFFDVRLIDNWWALFILIPTVASLNNAWQRYRETGHWSEAAIGSLTGGLLIGAVAMIFLLGLRWGMFWPVLLIILGLSILLRRG